jgi:hypothetical protein
MSAGLRTLPLRCYRGLKFHILFEPNAMRQKKKGGRSRRNCMPSYICSGSCGSSGMPISWAKSFARITSVGTCFHSYVGGATAYGKKQKQQAHRSYGGWLARTIKTQR